MQSNDNHSNASFARRCAALFYDFLLLLSILFVATGIAMAFNRGSSLHGSWFRLYLLGAVYLFYAWFWTHGGQTLGMRAWHLQLVDRQGRTPDLRRATLRFAAALLSLASLGLGFFWILIDRQGLAWHDRLSATRVIRAAPRDGSQNPA